MIEQRHSVQRINVSHEVPAHAIGINQFHHARLSQRVLMHLLFAGEQRIAIDIPTQRRVRNSQIEENIFVELVFAEQQLMYAREESARLSALDDAVIVGAADRDRFADAKLRHDRWVDRLIFRGILNRAGRDDERLTRH